MSSTPESVESFMARKHSDTWQRRFRKALRGYLPVGIVLPGEQRRDDRGRFTQKMG